MATEIERKFLIRLPDFEAIPKCRVQAMTQTYLNILPDDPGLERRVRWIAENGQNRFLYTEKLSISSGTAAVRQEDEWEISAEEYADKVENAGAVFVGKNCPEALGDYFAGPNHTLPTSGTAMFASPLAVDDFMKSMSLTYYDSSALEKAKDKVALLAREEGLEGHALSILGRFE